MATIAVSGIRQDLKRIISSSLDSTLHQGDDAGLGRLSGLSSCETLRLALALVLEGTAGCDLNQTPLVCVGNAVPPFRPSNASTSLTRLEGAASKSASPTAATGSTNSSGTLLTPMAGWA